MRLSARWKPLLGSPRDVAPAAWPLDLWSPACGSTLDKQVGKEAAAAALAPGSTRRDPLAGTLRRRRDSPRPGESALAGGCRVTAESDGARPQPILP